MMTTDAKPQRMACAVDRELPKPSRDGSPRMTMLRAPSPSMIARGDVASEPELELDAATRLRRAAHDAIAAFARSKA
jgi:hypothetical protein